VTESRLRQAGLIAAVALLLVTTGGAVWWWNAFEEDVDCAARELLACGEGDWSQGPRGQFADPESVQFPDATDLTAGADAFTETDGYLSVAAPDVWLPDLEPEGWTPIPAEDLEQAKLGFESDGVQIACYRADQRNILFVDFLDDESVFSAIAVAQRSLYGESAVYERASEPVFGHYRIDGNAVLAAEAEYTWTSAVDPYTGGTVNGEWTERWGFVAVYRGNAATAVCSYGGPDSSEALGEAQELLLGIRLAQ
jgi:hypothetical protein